MNSLSNKQNPFTYLILIIPPLLYEAWYLKKSYVSDYGYGNLTLLIFLIPLMLLIRGASRVPFSSAGYSRLLILHIILGVIGANAWVVLMPIAALFFDGTQMIPLLLMAVLLFFSTSKFWQLRST